MAPASLPRIAGNASTDFFSSILSASARLSNHFFKVPLSFDGRPPTPPPPLPPPPKLPVTLLLLLFLYLKNWLYNSSEKRKSVELKKVQLLRYPLQKQ